MSDVAVIIPCYNGAAFIEGAIRSVLAQTRPVKRIVVVDDVSSDRSVAVAEAFREAGAPVSVIVADRNGGPASARNIGIAATDEPLLAFLDADDRWTPHHCATLVPLLERHPDAALAFSRVRQVPLDSIGHPTVELDWEPSADDGQCGPILEELLYDNPVAQSAVIVRRPALEGVGGYLAGLRHSEDYDLWLRLAHSSPFVWTSAVTCTRMMHEDQATNQSLRMYTGAWKARARYRTFAEQAGAIVAEQRYRQICMDAYDRDLQWAWQSRSLSLLCEVLQLARMVPGGEIVKRRWTRRVVAYWPIWRAAALVWDLLPEGVRRRAGVLRRSTSVIAATV